jgi:penicillin-binding protein 1A
MEVGPDAVIEEAHRLGIESKLQSNVSIALGTSEVTPLELTAAYVPFANGGYKPDIHFVQRITTTGGEVLYENAASTASRVISPEIVGMMNAMMRQTVDAGTGRKAAFAWPAAGKTGTSQNSRDAWFIGYTADLTTGVWFGNDDAEATRNITGGSLPVVAWHDFMVAAHQGLPIAQLPGDWQPQPQPEAAVPPATVSATDLPDAPVGVPPDPQPPSAQPAAPERQAARQPLPQASPEPQIAIPDAPDQPAEADGRFDAPPATLPTASIRRPVPPADVGGPNVRRQGSLLDVLLGNP